MNEESSTIYRVQWGGLYHMGYTKIYRTLGHVKSAIKGNRHSYSPFPDKVWVGEVIWREVDLRDLLGE